MEFYQFCYGVFTLQYFESLDSFLEVCTFNKKVLFTSIILNYVTTLCPIIIVFIVWLIRYTSDYCVFMGQQNIFFRGLVTFLILSYTKFTLVTLSILTSAYLSGLGGKSYGLVVNLDGTLEYFGTKPLAYALPVVIVLVLFVLLPLAVMVMYPHVSSICEFKLHT